jgi:hypothetical protein
MIRTDSIGLEWDDCDTGVPAFALTADGEHYLHLASNKLYSRASIDAQVSEFQEGELGGDVPAPKAPPPIAKPRRSRAATSAVEDDED